MWKVLLPLSKRVMRGRPRHLLVCCSRTLWQKSRMSPQTGSSPAQRLVCNRTDDNVSQKETSRAHDTDGRVRLLAHRLVLVLVNRLNNGNSRLPLPRNVWTSSRSRFVLLRMLKNNLAKRSHCWQKGMFTMFCTFYKALFCNAVLVSVLSHAFLTIQEKQTHRPKTNWGRWLVALSVQNIWQWLGLLNNTSAPQTVSKMFVQSISQFCLDVYCKRL
jgi:hypothetical protein